MVGLFVLVVVGISSMGSVVWCMYCLVMLLSMRWWKL